MTRTAPRIVLACLVLSTLLQAGASPAASRATLGPRGEMDWRLLAGLDEAIWSGTVTLKLVPGLEPVLDGAVVLDGSGQTLLDLATLVPPGALLRAEQGFGVDPQALLEMRRRGEAACLCTLADMREYLDLDLRREAVDLPALLAALNASPLVEIAYPVCDLRLIPPPEDIWPDTPDFTAGQMYLDPAPTGVDAGYAAGFPGGRGEGTSVCDIEAGWDPGHEDLETCATGQVPGIGTIDTSEMRHVHHGTAVLGVMVAGDNGYGVTGIVPDSACYYAPEFTLEHGMDMPRAILTAMDHIPAEAALILLEAQTGGPNYDYTTPSQDGLVPMEWEPAVYDSIRMAVANGYVIVEAAGNGREDLDDTRYYANLFDPDYRDSGAIIVGGGKPPSEPDPRAPEWFTNYGRRVNVQGWGGGVVTTGYGDLFDGGGDLHQNYTSTFAGTSSASPIVTGAAAALAGIYLAETGTAMDPVHVRDVLVATGTPQYPDDRHIGPLPDLRQAIGTAIPVCGDSIVHADEACDDGNDVGGDGCSADCFSDESCGNSTVDSIVGEMCDDGNTTGGDGCSADCLSTEICGNGHTDTLLGEVCDDGNLVDGDGCSMDCLSDETCGNGIRDRAAGEACDDGNLVDGDGCSHTCRREDSGCGCELITGSRSPWPLLALLALLAGLALRRIHG